MIQEYRPEIAEFLEYIYSECNTLKRLDRDPLAVVLRYAKAADREVAGLVCSTLAFGSVDLIIRACGEALAPLGGSPSIALESMDDSDIERYWAGFQYRFCFPVDMKTLLRAIREARRRYGSLEGLFLLGDQPGKALNDTAEDFVRALRRLGSEGGKASLRRNLLPDPSDGSACKRLFLFFRWMVRRDAIDPGGWGSVSPSRLIVPLDVHMARTCRDRLGFLTKASAARSPTLKDALAVTAQFAMYSPGDPVKYDFALTRPGIDPRPGDEIFGCL